MRFMCFQWRAFSQDDLEEALQKKGIELDFFSYQFSGIHNDAYFHRNFSSVLSDGDYDAVISWNFWPLVAQVCYELSIPYIAWIYDCPISYEIMPWASYPTSYLFMFDRAEYEKYAARGIPHLFHQQLAVNTERLDAVTLDEGDNGRFCHDVTFLGTMYTTVYPKMGGVLTDYERGYLDAVMAVQRDIRSGLIFSEALPDGFLREMQERLAAEDYVHASNNEDFDDWLITMLAKEQTCRDRISLLNRMGEIYPTAYYCYHKYPEIKNAEYAGKLDYREGMFKMFRATKINLNISYRLITKGIPLRALDIMAAGGFLLSNWQEELVEHFRPGIDFVFYETEDEAVELTGYYLQHEEERRQIAENGHKAVKAFDYSVRLGEILDIVFPENNG